LFTKLLGATDAGEKSFTDCIVLALADLERHGAVVLAGSAKRVEVEEEVARL
jgi:hypothetical protein